MIIAYGLKAAEDAGLEAGTDEYKQAVIDAIKTMDGVKGITGTYSFDSDNNPIKSVAIIELTGGEEVFKEMELRLPTRKPFSGRPMGAPIFSV